MKITMTPDELMDFVTSGKIPESVKQNLAGGILAMCNSKEMSAAILSKVEAEIRNVMHDALIVQTEGYYSGGNKSLKGWAAEIMLTELTNKAKEIDLKQDVIRQIVAEEVRKLFTDSLKDNVRQTIIDEYREILLQRVEKQDLEPLVEAKVKKALAGILVK